MVDGATHGRLSENIAASAVFLPVSASSALFGYSATPDASSDLHGDLRDAVAEAILEAMDLMDGLDVISAQAYADAALSVIERWAADEPKGET